MSVVQKRPDSLVEILRPDFVSNDGNAYPTFAHMDVTGSIRASVSIGVRAYSNVNFLHNNTGNWLTIPFTHQRWDDPDDNQWAVAPNPTRLTCQFAGIYVISGSIRWAPNAVGGRALDVYLNGATAITRQTEQGVFVQDLYQSVTTIYNLIATDYLEMRVHQTSGGNLNIISGGNYSPEFSMVRCA